MVTAGAREQANQAALARMCGSDPVLTDVAAARDVVPGMTGRTILTSGRPCRSPAIPAASGPR